MNRLIKACLFIVSVGMFSTSCNTLNQPSEDQQPYESEVMLKFFNFKTSHDFEIKIPETTIVCKIDKVENDSPTFMASGLYSNDLEKGKVIVDFTLMKSVSNAINGEYMFVAPYRVTNQGTGVFSYLGLFSMAAKDGVVRHLDSKYIGDRVEINGIDLKSNGDVNIRFLSHVLQEAFAEAPKEPHSIKLRVEDYLFSEVY